MNKLFLFLFVVVLATGCKCKSKIASKEPVSLYPKIVFGQGGGFAGKVSQYCLDQSGKLYQITKTDTALLKTLDKETLSSCFDKVKALKLESQKINYPGNLYYFISIINSTSSTSKATWGDPKFEAPAGVTECYSYLKGVVKN